MNAAAGSAMPQTVASVPVRRGLAVPGQALGRGSACCCWKTGIPAGQAEAGGWSRCLEAAAAASSELSQIVSPPPRMAAKQASGQHARHKGSPRDSRQGPDGTGTVPV
jgi:hypothetical protein